MSKRSYSLIHTFKSNIKSFYSTDPRGPLFLGKINLKPHLKNKPYQTHFGRFFPFQKKKNGHLVPSPRFRATSPCPSSSPRRPGPVASLWPGSRRKSRVGRLGAEGKGGEGREVGTVRGCFCVFFL